MNTKEIQDEEDYEVTLADLVVKVLEDDRIFCMSAGRGIADEVLGLLENNQFTISSSFLGELRENYLDAYKYEEKRAQLTHLVYGHDDKIKRISLEEFEAMGRPEKLSINQIRTYRPTV